MKILITGSTGFVGRNLIPHLIDSNYLILPVRNFEKAKSLFYNLSNIELVDFSENLASLVISYKPEVIINLSLIHI